MISRYEKIRQDSNPLTFAMSIWGHIYRNMFLPKNSEPNSHFVLPAAGRTKAMELVLRV